MTASIAKGTRHTLVFTHYGPEGFAVGDADGVAVYVDGGIEGERATVEVEHVSPHQPQAWARLVSLEEPSPHRARAFDDPEHRCGGCSWSHLDPVAQLAAKEERLREVVAACGEPVRPLPTPLVVPSPKPAGYRNRGKYVLARKHGKVVLGGYRPRSHVVASTLGCPVMDPAVDDAARALASALGHRRWSIYDEDQSRGLLRHAAIRSNHAGQVLITLVVTREADRPWKMLAKGLRQRIPNLKGLTLDVNPDPGNVIFAGQTVRIWGSGELVDRYGDAVVRLTGQGFGQVNREVATALYAHAADAALAPLPGRDAPPARIWDLFSGAGALTQTLARRAAAEPGSAPVDILGVERDEAAVTLARGAARSADLQGCHYRAADANELLAGPVEALPEVVVLNPPRTGCRPPLLTALTALTAQRIPRVVYVSCSAETLIRDLAALQQGGFKLQSLQGFDMLPLTPHLELVAVLERDRA